LSKTLKKNVKVERYHDGQYVKFESIRKEKEGKEIKEETEMWTCCSKKGKDAEGCIKRYINLP